jgi:hypothetical protein
MTDRDAQRQAAIDELLEMLRHERRGDEWVGRTPDWGPVVFGGITLALTVSAACGDAPEGSRLHTIHGHFLRLVPWIVPEFAVDRFRIQLRELHEHILRVGSFDTSSCRFLLDARRT